MDEKQHFGVFFAVSFIFNMMKSHDIVIRKEDKKTTRITLEVKPVDKSLVEAWKQVAGKQAPGSGSKH